MENIKMPEDDKISKVRHYTGEIVDPLAILKSLAGDPRVGRTIPTRPDVRKCICGHTMHRHNDVARFEFLKQVSKPENSTACADCDCEAFAHASMIKQLCKCGHDKKYHIKQEIVLDGKRRIIEKCKYDRCANYCFTFTEQKKFKTLTKREYHAYVAKKVGYDNSSNGPKALESINTSDILKKLKESEAEVANDSPDLCEE